MRLIVPSRGRKHEKQLNPIGQVFRQNFLFSPFFILEFFFFFLPNTEFLSLDQRIENLVCSIPFLGSFILSQINELMGPCLSSQESLILFEENT